MEAEDILILASDGMGDNLWEEDVLDEVRRAVEAHTPLTNGAGEAQSQSQDERARMGRRTLAGILSESLCSRAHQVSRQDSSKTRSVERHSAVGEREEADLPFARRAREAGRSFRGGKCDGECCCLRLDMTLTLMDVCGRYFCVGCSHLAGC